MQFFWAFKTFSAIYFQTDHQDSIMDVFISFDLEAVSQFSHYVVKSARVFVSCIT